MKYNPYDDEVTAERRTGRPPLPADAKYREQEQGGEMFEDTDDGATGKLGDNETPSDPDQPPLESNVDADDQAGDDEDAYHPITPQKPENP